MTYCPLGDKTEGRHILVLFQKQRYFVFCIWYKKVKNCQKNAQLCCFEGPSECLQRPSKCFKILQNHPKALKGLSKGSKYPKNASSHPTFSVFCILYFFKNCSILNFVQKFTFVIRNTTPYTESAHLWNFRTPELDNSVPA